MGGKFAFQALLRLWRSLHALCKCSGASIAIEVGNLSMREKYVMTSVYVRKSILVISNFV